MNYEETKRISMDAYPSLFIHESNLLDHLFFTIGNGYKWVDGELVSGNKSDYDTAIRFSRNHTIAQAEESIRWEKQRAEEDRKEAAEIDDEIKRDFLLRMAHISEEAEFWHGMVERAKNYTPDELREYERQNRLRYIEEDDEDLYDNDGNPYWYLTDDGEVGHQIYPISEYSRIMTVPADVKPDWLDAVKRTFELARSPIMSLTDRDEKRLCEAEQRLKDMGLL